MEAAMQVELESKKHASKSCPLWSGIGHQIIVSLPRQNDSPNGALYKLQPLSEHRRTREAKLVGEQECYDKLVAQSTSHVVPKRWRA